MSLNLDKGGVFPPTNDVVHQSPASVVETPSKRDQVGTWRNEACHLYIRFSQVR